MLWDLADNSDSVSMITYYVNGRGFDVNCLDLGSLGRLDEDADGYYEVQGPNIKSTLIFSGPRLKHKRVLEHALSKWYEMGEIDEGLANWPTDQILEV